MTPEEKKIFNLQCPSTQKALSRPKTDDWDWQRRPIPIDWKAVLDAKTWEEQVGARALTFQEVKVENTLRYYRGEYLAEMRGEAPVSSIDEVKREKAIGAFMFIKKTFLEIMEMAGLAPKKREFDYAEIIAKEKNEK